MIYQMVFVNSIMQNSCLVLVCLWACMLVNLCACVLVYMCSCVLVYLCSVCLCTGTHVTFWSVSLPLYELQSVKSARRAQTLNIVNQLLVLFILTELTSQKNIVNHSKCFSSFVINLWNFKTSCGLMRSFLLLAKSAFIKVFLPLDNIYDGAF